MKAAALFVSLIGAAYAQTSGVAVQVTLERLKDNRWSAVDPRLVLRGGDEVRFRFRSNMSGRLYVINHDGQGGNTWLFPTPDTGEQNAIDPGKDYIIPATAGVFQIAQRPGFETTYWILSPGELQVKKALPETSEADRTPLLPRCGDGSLVARGDCTSIFAGPHPSSYTQLRRWFDYAAPLQSRQLNIDKAQNRIRSSGVFDAPIVYEFRIAHR